MKLVIPAIALIAGMIGLTVSRTSYGDPVTCGRDSALGTKGPPGVVAAPASPKGPGKGRSYATLDLHWAPDSMVKTNPAPNCQNSQPPSAPWVKLGKVPVLKLARQQPVSREEAARIKRLIAQLAEIDSGDYGLSPTYSGTVFPVLPDLEGPAALHLTPARPNSSPALRTLIALGPRALRFLLAALDDRTPTRLTVRRRTWGAESIGFAFGIWRNPVSAAEQKVASSGA